MMQKTVNIVLSLHDGRLGIDLENAEDDCEIMRLPKNVMISLEVYGPLSSDPPEQEKKIRDWINKKSPDHREYDGWIDTEKTVGGPAIYRWYGKQDCCF